VAELVLVRPLVSSFVDTVFPKRLPRLPFVVRIVIIDVLFWSLVQWKRSLPLPMTDVQLWMFISGCLVIAVYSTFFAIVPRLRDAGSSAWWAAVGLVPIVWILVHLILAIVPPKAEVATNAV
jgi:uncharacterized membrane protein YhaH (DUF805 family)